MIAETDERRTAIGILFAQKPDNWPYSGKHRTRIISSHVLLPNIRQEIGKILSEIGVKNYEFNMARPDDDYETLRIPIDDFLIRIEPRIALYGNSMRIEPDMLIVQRAKTNIFREKDWRFESGAWHRTLLTNGEIVATQNNLKGYKWGGNVTFSKLLDGNYDMALDDTTFKKYIGTGRTP